MSIFSRLSDDFRHRLLGLAVGVFFLAPFFGLGLGIAGAVLAPVVAVGVCVLSGEVPHRKEASEAESNLDARYRDAEALSCLSVKGSRVQIPSVRLRLVQSNP